MLGIRKPLRPKRLFQNSQSLIELSLPICLVSTRTILSTSTQTHNYPGFPLRVPDWTRALSSSIRRVFCGRFFHFLEWKLALLNSYYPLSVLLGWSAWNICRPKWPNINHFTWFNKIGDTCTACYCQWHFETLDRPPKCLKVLWITQLCWIGLQDNIYLTPYTIL